MADDDDRGAVTERDLGTGPVTEPTAAPTTITPQRRRVAGVLHLLGTAGLPLALGAMLGFYAADRGMRWLPTMLGLVLVAAIVSLALISAARIVEGSAWHPTVAGRRVRRRVIVTLALLAVAVMLRLALFWVARPTPLTAMSEVEFNRAFAADVQQYREYDETLRGLVDAIAQREAMLQPDAVLSPSDELALRQAWGALHDAAVALDQIRMFYEDWWHFDPSRAERDRHLRSFLLTYAAELALYEKGARFVALVTKNSNARKFLDAPHAELGLDAGSLSHFEQDVLGARDEARVVAGEQYLAWMASALEGRSTADATGVAWLWRRIDGHIAAVGELGVLQRRGLQLAADFEVLRRNVRRAWYPAQSKVAEWMGDTRVRRPGWYLITESQQEQMDAALQPGDVMLSRKNWYVSNVGLPGFWPHALIYLGAPEKLAAYFDDPDVRAWVREQSGRDEALHEWLAHEHPSAWLRYEAGDGEGTYRVMEAISEGVSLNTLAHASGDYLAVMRPRLSKRAKAQAIAAAFAHLDKPYDYDFDFATDHALVCTELVWRSYRPAPGKDGLEIPLVDMAGRKTLPANQIAALFADERGRSDAQLEFVWFYDATEHAQTAFEADENAFAQSHARVKWDLALE
ncbi:MAG TPA: YiiX/YebB-like N1pC/P60 family cysteine hydrolase [Nannocystaceae bacterium]|nr:YiiX/YebB-like N1pC/P60 family cysteine hydrolase [Nannocystaceae bacterium]